jgi:type IV secretory pathway TrbL component
VIARANDIIAGHVKFSALAQATITGNEFMAPATVAALQLAGTGRRVEMGRQQLFPDKAGVGGLESQPRWEDRRRDVQRVASRDWI